LLRYTQIQLDAVPYRWTAPNDRELFSDDRTRFKEDIRLQLPPADILNLHWIASFVDLQSFFEHTSCPVVWTLHDMNAFTGGCHYDMGCERYKESCGRCPQLGSQAERDLSRSIWNRKRVAYEKAIRRGRLHIVAPSNWLAEEVEESSLLGEAPLQVIPYGVDATVFRPRMKQDTRERLGISKQRTIILFVAQSTTDCRKGFSFLVSALKDLDSDEKVTLLSIGQGSTSLPLDLPYVNAGRIEEDEVLAKLYSVADLFIIPSRQDNLPNTVLESMACGTPVIGFDAGGIPDMVRPGETGWLAETGNVRSLRQAIESALENDGERQRMG